MKMVWAVIFDLDGLNGEGLQDLSGVVRRVTAMLRAKSTMRAAFDRARKMHSSVPES